MTAIRRGERLLQVGVVLRFGVGVPPRGEAFGYALGIAGWPLFDAGRASFKWGVVLRFGVGTPSRGEVFSGPWLGKLS